MVLFFRCLLLLSRLRMAIAEGEDGDGEVGGGMEIECRGP